MRISALAFIAALAAGSAAFAQDTINRGEAGAGTAAHTVQLHGGGGITVTSGSLAWNFDSYFSYPGGLNHLTCDPTGAWAGSLSRDGAGTSITAVHSSYTMVRTLTATAHGVTVRDRITNTSGLPLGMHVKHQLSLIGIPAPAIRKAGFSPATAYNSPANPTVHVASGATSIGMTANDDILRNQAWLFSDGLNAGFYTSNLYVPAGMSHTLEWAIYPVASAQYFDFVNLVRQDWGSNFMIDGPWHVWAGYRDILTNAEFAATIASGMAHNKFKYSIELGGWIDPAVSTSRIGFGTEVMADNWANYRNNLRLVVQKLKTAKPDLKVLVYYDTMWDTYPDAPTRYYDSRLINAAGHHEYTDWGGYYQRTYNYVATATNSYGIKMLEAADYLIDQVGADGLNWDELEAKDYGEPLITHNMADGSSCILGAGYTFVQEAAFVPLVGKAHRLAVINKMRQRGKAIAGNTPPLTRDLGNAQLPRYTENYLAYRAEFPRIDIPRQADLGCPMGYILLDKTWAGLLKYMKNPMLPMVFWFDYPYDILPYLFPITPRELHPGYILGDERLFTMYYGNYGWAGEKALVKAYYFNTAGTLTPNAYVTTIGATEARTQLPLIDEAEAAVLEKLPVTVAPRAGTAQASQAQYGADSISFTFTCGAAADLAVSTGTFVVTNGLAYDVVVNGIIHKTVAAALGKITSDLPASTNAAITIRRGTGAPTPDPDPDPTPDPANHAPTAVADMDFEGPLTGTTTIAAPGVLANDTDPDGDALTAVLVNDYTVGVGNLTLNPDGSFSFTPTVGLSDGNPVGFTYKAVDPSGAESAAVTVLVTLRAVAPPEPVTYTLTVNGGTGDGSYEADAQVSITADAAPQGQVFDRWTGDTGALASTTSATTTVTMPASNVTVTATYATPPPTTYTLTVNSGTGDGSFASGTQVSIAADAAPQGQVFDRWTGDTGTLASTTSATTTVTMPASNVTVTATYATPPPTTYTLTVNSGTGDGTYEAGEQVSIVADAAPQGQVFDRWTGDTGALASTTSATTTVTMPAGNVTVTATYATPPPTTYTLTVNSGTGDGSFASGTQVSITADAAPQGQVFDRWTGDTGALASTTSATTTVTMPAGNVTVTATYTTPAPEPEPENQAPSGTMDTYDGPLTGTFTIAAPGVLTNDNDPDGDALTAVLVHDYIADIGNLTLNADGSFTVEITYPSFADGDPIAFTYKAVDPSGAESTETTVLITLRASVEPDPEPQPEPQPDPTPTPDPQPQPAPQIGTPDLPGNDPEGSSNGDHMINDTLCGGTIGTATGLPCLWAFAGLALAFLPRRRR